MPTTFDDRTPQPDSPLSAKDQAAAAAGTARDQAAAVTGTAKDQAGSVVQDAQQHAQNLVGQASEQISAQAGEQTRQLSKNLHGWADEFEQMAASGQEGSSSQALVSDVATRSRRLASYLEGHEPGEVIEDVKRFGRRRPGAFLLGAALTGVLVGRLGKAAKNSNEDDSSAVIDSRSGATRPGGKPTLAGGSDLASGPHGAPTITPPVPSTPANLGGPAL